jgi:hypothetical protein
VPRLCLVHSLVPSFALDDIRGGGHGGLLLSRGVPQEEMGALQEDVVGFEARFEFPASVGVHSAVRVAIKSSIKLFHRTSHNTRSPTARYRDELHHHEIGTPIHGGGGIISAAKKALRAVACIINIALVVVSSDEKKYDGGDKKCLLRSGGD